MSALVLLDASGVRHLLAEGLQQQNGLGFKILSTPVVNRIADHITPRNVVRATLEKAFADPRLATPSMVERYHDLLLHPGNRVATRLMVSAGDETAASARLGELKMPTLILWGDKDALVPVESAAVFDAQIPNSSVILYPGIGHLPMEEAADASARDLLKFVATVN